MGDIMKKTTFNLKKYVKLAFYDDARGYWNNQTRAWNNCYKLKSDKGMQPQAAWDNCLRDYQSSADRSKWVLSYTSDQDDSPKPYFSAKTPAAEKIIKK